MEKNYAALTFLASIIMAFTYVQYGWRARAGGAGDLVRLLFVPSLFVLFGFWGIFSAGWDEYSALIAASMVSGFIYGSLAELQQPTPVKKHASNPARATRFALAPQPLWGSLLSSNALLHLVLTSVEKLPAVAGFLTTPTGQAIAPYARSLALIAGLATQFIATHFLARALICYWHAAGGKKR